MLGGACPGRCPAWFPRPRPARTYDQVVPVDPSSSEYKSTTRTVLAPPAPSSLPAAHHCPAVQGQLMSGLRALHTRGTHAKRDLMCGVLERDRLCASRHKSVSRLRALARVRWERSLPSRQPLNSFRAPPGHPVFPFPLTFWRLQWACEHCATGRNLSLRPIGLVLQGVPSNLSHLMYHAEL